VQTLTFVIPIRHPQNALDWADLKRKLAETIASIMAQDDSDWRAVIVANRGADLPELPPSFSVAWVDFPPNAHYSLRANQPEFVEALRYDKGRRILAGMLFAPPTNFLMVVDDDDFIHRGLTSFAKSHTEENGWYFKEGYVWEEGSGIVYLCTNFSQMCGTSHMIRPDLLQLPPSSEEASEKYVKEMLGSHVIIDSFLQECGTPLQPLPFPGAVYRVGHSGSVTRSRGLYRQFLYRKNPLRMLRQFLLLRVKTKTMNETFFGLQ
jgi:hypothetical protein